MPAISDLDQLLRSLSPRLFEPEFVFCTVPGQLADYLSLNPVATFLEPEGLTLVLEKSAALQAGLAFDSTFRQITLQVHSSLEAVGLTAAVATQLTKAGISANVIAAYHHDHVFVPDDKADAALAALQQLSA
ncbi:MAG: ACT domain-containing protein [Natronospirillum sp.]|uniref:ACT domain-containing protein n=1 Tax=Natronospirillum sp. TaxID=2812955 RepID=UPI0025D925A3|nr:ACT domain-containing protein [Natronospirillum sp.]MCH8552804.1 ACT domain-containing protein [Natronospirillum sp.]